MPRATICIDAQPDDRQTLDDWLERWQTRLIFVSENEGCGCCVDIYHVDAPQNVLNELPQEFFADSDWARRG